MKKKFWPPSLRSLLTIVVVAAFLVASAVALILIYLLGHLFDLSSDALTAVWALIACSAIGSVITAFMNKRILAPIRHLREAMKAVSKGDFEVRLNPKSNIQDIQEMNENFNLMVQELGSHELLQADFVSNVSHEFKTPINAIEGYAMLLQGTQEVTSEQQEYIDKILYNTQRLSGLVGNVLLLAKLENQQIPSSSKPYRLDEQIRQSIMLLESQWLSKEIDFDVEMESITYCGNVGLMLHVWSNLLSNAIKFNCYGGLVRMRLKQEADQIIFTIEDEGPGISPEDQKHIFDKFYQGDNSHEQEGNGLGLSLVSRIVRICEGSISAANRPEQGAIFTVLLPVRAK